MPFVVRSDSENEAELVFLSPEEEFSRPTGAEAKGDQGASPVLRRSNRKRKSTTVYCEKEMTKNSGKKKKSASPDPGKSMPKFPGPHRPSLGKEVRIPAVDRRQTPSLRVTRRTGRHREDETRPEMEDLWRLYS